MSIAPTGAPVLWHFGMVFSPANGPSGIICRAPYLKMRLGCGFQSSRLYVPWCRLRNAAKLALSGCIALLIVVSGSG